MKHRRSLFASMWIIAIGIFLLIIAPTIVDYGVIYHAGDWLHVGWYEYTGIYDFAVALFWVGVAMLILGSFGIVTTMMREYLDREKDMKS